jgi:hypothetical protein
MTEQSQIRKSKNQRIKKSANQEPHCKPRRFADLPICRFATVPLFLAAATLLFFWPVWIAGYRFPRGGGDLWGQLHPVWSYVATWVRRGVFPLWNTRMMAGDPIVAEGQYGLFNPLNWPLFLRAPVPAWAVTVRGMASLWLAGVGFFLYMRHSPVWRLGRTAALVGALAYMFADPFVAHLGHPQFNDAIAWLPWTLWAIDGAARRAWAIPLAAGALALVMLAGHGQASLYTALAAGAYALWQALEGGLRHGPRRLGRLALVGLLAAGLAAPSVLPGLARLPYTERALVPWDLRRGYEFHPAMLINLLAPDVHGRGIEHYWAPWDRVEGAYVGAVALYLAPLGLVHALLRRRRRRQALFLIGLGVLAYLFALGYRGPIYPHIARLPLFALSWKTARMVFLLSFALAVSAALGVQSLTAMTHRHRGWSRTWARALALLGLALWLPAPRWVQAVPAGGPRERALVGLRLAAELAVGTALLARPFLSEAHDGGGRWARALARAGLPLLLLAELTALGARVETEPAPQRTEDPHAAAIAYLRSDPGWFRVDVDTTARGLWSPSAIQAAGFASPQGAGNPMELAAFSQFYWAVPTKGAPAYQLFGAKYIVVPKGAPPGGEGIWPVFTDDPLIDLHLNTNALPRVWLVYDTLPVSRIEAAYDVVFAEDFRPAHVATVEDGPADAPDLQGEGRGTLEVLAYGPNRARFGVHTSETALLVLSDIVYPGWRARVDGAPAPIYRTDGIFRGVVVPPGDHVVSMRFFPPSLRHGLGLAMMAASVILVGLYGRRYVR